MEAIYLSKTLFLSNLCFGDRWTSMSDLVSKYEVSTLFVSVLAQLLSVSSMHLVDVFRMVFYNDLKVSHLQKVISLHIL